MNKQTSSQPTKYPGQAFFKEKERRPFWKTLLGFAFLVCTCPAANGSTVSTQSITANSTIEMNTATYPAGMYLLTLKGADGVTKSTQVVKVNQ